MVVSLIVVWLFHRPGQPGGKRQLRRLDGGRNQNHNRDEHGPEIVRFKHFQYHSRLIPFHKSDVFVPQMMAHPHCQDQTNVA